MLFSRAAVAPFLALVLIAPPVAAQDCQDDGTCEAALADCAPVAPDVPIGSLPLAFIPAPNDQDGFFAFADNASVTVDYGGAAVLTVDDGNASTSLSLAPDTLQPVRASAQLAAGRVVLNGLEPGDARAYAAHQLVALGEVRDGVSAAFSGQGRMLSLGFRIDAGVRDPSVGVRLGGEGLRLMAPDGARVPVQAGNHQMTLYVHASTGTDKSPQPVPIELRVVDGRVIATPGVASRRLPTRVVFELLHGEYADAPATRVGGGDVLAVLTSVLPGAGSRQPVAVRQLGDAWIWSTWGGRQSGSASSVTADGDDALVVVDRDGDVELARLGSDMVLSSAVSIGGNGDDRALGVAVDDDLVYVLASLDAPQLAARPFSALRTQLPDTGRMKRPPFETYLVALHHDRDEPVFAQPIDVPVEVTPVVWIDCEGVPVVGVEILNGAMTCDTQAFSIPPRQNDFSNGFVESPGEWGHMLLQWKQFNASYQAAGSPATPPPPGDPSWTTVAFAPANATPPAGSVLAPGLGAGHATTLNGIEADSTVFPGGDPGGGWQYGNADDLAELGIAVGLYADCCGSPVAFAPNFAGARQPMVALGVQYCIHGGVFSQINDLIMDWDDGLAWHPDNNPMDYVDQLWATTYGNSFLSDDYFEVTELYVSHWDGGSFAQNQTLADPDIGALFSPLFPGQTVATDYIGDPPEELPYGDAVADELSKRLQGKGVRSLSVASSIWRDGQLVDRESRERQVPVARLKSLERR